MKLLWENTRDGSKPQCDVCNRVLWETDLMDRIVGEEGRLPVEKRLRAWLNGFHGGGHR